MSVWIIVHASAELFRSGTRICAGAGPPLSASLEFRGHVSYLAKRHYDGCRGRSDWDAVAGALRVPLLECLQAFDSRSARIIPRHWGEDHEWPLEDIQALKEFTETHFRHRMTVEDWVLAGKYMNIYHSDCIAKMWSLNSFQMTPQLYSLIAELRQAGLLWPTVCEKLPVSTGSADVVRFVYASTAKDSVQKAKRPKAQFRISKHQHWTEDEDRQLVELLGRFGNGRDIDWNFISSTIGHSKNACRYRRILLQRPQKGRPSSSPRSESPADDADLRACKPVLV